MRQVPDGRIVTVDVLIIGAGQAGLVTGRLLQEVGISFIIHERNERIGDSWRRRYDSLTLFTSRELDGLHGLRLDGDPSGYPGKDEIADYLQRYAATFHLPVVVGDGIISLRQEDGIFIGQTASASIVYARAVVIATGTFQKPLVPSFAEKLDPRILQLTAETYRNPRQLPPGRVLIVGGGATGRQLAHELQSTYEVWLSAGSHVVVTPQRVFGKDISWWWNRLGAHTADKVSPFGRFVRSHESIPGWQLRNSALRKRGVKIVSRTVGARGDALQFVGAGYESFDTVIWTIGYGDDTSWMKVPEAIAADRRFLEDRGISTVAGLFFVGRSWQNNRASGLLCGVSRDASGIVEKVLTYLRQQVVPSILA